MRNPSGVIVVRNFPVMLALLAGWACGARSALDGPASGGASGSTTQFETGGTMTQPETGGTTALAASGGTLSMGGAGGTTAMTQTETGGTTALASSGGTVAIGGAGGTAVQGTGGQSPSGCSDGTREAFTNPLTHPSIAGCSGGFMVPGILVVTDPTCGRIAGNSSQNPQGVGCSAADLCALGFHVCQGAIEVALASPTGCVDATSESGLFFATRQGSNGCGVCTLGTNTDPSLCDGATCASDCAPNPKTANDVFGCGTMGADTGGSCGVLDRFSHDLCFYFLGTPWDCGSDGFNEANFVTKNGPDGGGVLCCAD